MPTQARYRSSSAVVGENVASGSLAVIAHDISLMAGFGSKADIGSHWWAGPALKFSPLLNHGGLPKWEFQYLPSMGD